MQKKVEFLVLFAHSNTDELQSNFLQSPLVHLVLKCFTFFTRRHQINLAVLSMKENGRLQVLQNKCKSASKQSIQTFWIQCTIAKHGNCFTGWMERSECPPAKYSLGDDDELSLSSLAGIFYILIVGLGLALIAAIIEFWWNSRKEARKNHVSLHNEKLKQLTSYMSII